jgi:UDP-N-acetylglucosamine--N-acetylmuramyl-(pentapeptide) pyrophosphoryl-undecaprenol N-acetylglucosamine transferase
MTGGGTAGHVTPNIALLPKLRAEGAVIHYIGSVGGMEHQLIEETDIPYHAVSAGRLRRYFDLRNVTDLFRVISGFRQAVALLRKLEPDVIFSKGGFVACPVVWAARHVKIPVVIHESDITPGLANRLSMPCASKICYTFPASKKYIPADKGVLTGLPVREEIIYGNAATGYRLCGFSSGKPVLLVMGGSQGAANINNCVRRALPRLLANFQVCHICGKGNISSAYRAVEGYKQFEYVSEEQPHLFAIADVVVSRAGATTLFELLSLKKPNLLIPLSRNVSRGDQIANAQAFLEQGYSCVLPEETLTAEALLDGVSGLYQNRRKNELAMNASETANAADAVMGVIKAVAVSGKTS